ncbi:hypothetical protein HKX48_003527 [Thoreauomyces humboldtii]|nr:hypothetical protein HKX48_003527 [Thoreauomyces humboldtii]
MSQGGGRPSSPPLYVGLDLSTQQLKCTVIDHDQAGALFLEESVNFDRDLPHHNTKGGANHAGLEAWASPLMWVEALDLLLEKLRKADFPFERVAGVSGCGQQHGSVYWRKGAETLLQDLDPSRSLFEQLGATAFTTLRSPIWQDSSTGEECRVLEDAVGGPGRLAEITGSSAYERFTGSQIMKFARGSSDLYEETERISLVSSFLASLLVGGYAPIEASDGSGMNLLNIKSHAWENTLLDACGRDLRRKLGGVVQGTDVIGSISRYYMEKYGFRKDCQVVAFTGDNPDSLASLNLTLGDVVVSLGTSDTLLFPLSDPHPSTHGHVLIHPTQQPGYMAMLVYKNGSLVREQIRDTYAPGEEWTTFDTLVTETDVGCGGCAGFYFPSPEITPRAKGVFKFGPRSSTDPIAEFHDPTINPRALLESQFMNMRSRAVKVGAPTPFRRVVVTGGASRNDAMCRVLADVFGATVVRSALGSGSAGLGGAWRARFAVSKREGREETFEDSMGVGKFVEVVRADQKRFERYTEMMGRYEELEAKVCELGRF